MKLKPEQLPDNPDDLKEMIVSLRRKSEQQQNQLHQQQNQLHQQQNQLHQQQDQLHQKDKELNQKNIRIEILEEQLRAQQQHRFGKRSERNTDQIEIQFLNEAELLAQDSESEPEETVEVPAHTRKKKPKRGLPEDLPFVEKIYDLPEEKKQCECGKQLKEMGEEVTEQLAVIPQQHYIVRHIRKKYACSCKACVRTAQMPNHPIPKSQASPQLLAHIMVSKYFDGLPLYRQEKIALRSGFDLPRQKMARWLIQCQKVFQPLFNLFQDQLLGYDITQADETGIQVLNEQGKPAESKSYLWIRRGGPPEKPVVLVDYSPSRSKEVASKLLSGCKGYLVADAYSGYNQAMKENGLKFSACNDHARRKFDAVLKSIKPTKGKSSNKAIVAQKAIQFYKSLYKIEREIAEKNPDEKYQIRQKKSVPIWQQFRKWLDQISALGVIHTGVREAVQYMLKYWEGLTRYLEDGRLPISNIHSEHVAKTIALARKNYLFASTEAGADTSAMIYSILETAKANQHHPLYYLTVLLTELPNCESIEEYEALLPWNLTPEAVKERYNSYPRP